jgi:hypothetical protein
MNDRERPSIPGLVVEVLRPMIIGAMALGVALAAPFVIVGIVLVIFYTPILRATFGITAGALTVWFIVRQFNRRDDPMHAKLPQ